MSNSSKFYDIYDYIYIPFWKTNGFLIFLAIATTLLISILSYVLIKKLRKNKAPKHIATQWEIATEKLTGANKTTKM